MSSRVLSLFYQTSIKLSEVREGSSGGAWQFLVDIHFCDSVINCYGQYELLWKFVGGSTASVIDRMKVFVTSLCQTGPGIDWHVACQGFDVNRIWSVGEDDWSERRSETDA